MLVLQGFKLYDDIITADIFANRPGGVVRTKPKCNITLEDLGL